MTQFKTNLLIQDCLYKFELSELLFDSLLQIIHLYFNYVKETIDPTVVAQELLAEDIISCDDEEEIRKIHKNETSANATLCLFEAIPRRSPDWYKKFLTILYKLDHKKLVEQLDEKEFSLLSKDDESLSRIVLSPVDDDFKKDEVSFSCQNVDTKLVSETVSREEFANPPEIDTIDRLKEEVNNLQKEVNRIPQLERKIDDLVHLIQSMDIKIEKILENTNRK